MQHITRYQDFALLFLRLILAAIFLNAGYSKLGFWSAAPEGTPLGMVYLIQFLSVVEPLGGIALLGGFLTRFAADGLSIIMFGSLFFIYFMMHAGFFTTPQGTGLDFNVMILGGCIALAAFGAGRWSVDMARKKA